MALRVLQLLTSVSVTLVLYRVYQLLKFAYKKYTSPLRDFPGPKSPSWLYGNFKEISAAVRELVHYLSGQRLTNNAGNFFAARKMGSRIWTHDQILRATWREVWVLLDMYQLTSGDDRLRNCIPWIRRRWTMYSWTIITTRNHLPHATISVGSLVLVCYSAKGGKRYSTNDWRLQVFFSLKETSIVSR